MILLDTQVLIWFAQGEPSLKHAARTLIQEQTANDTVAISPISFWEVAMLADKGRIVLGVKPIHWAEAVLAQRGFRAEPIAAAIAADAGSLPSGIHGDPADRIIIATARHLDCPVLTTDRKILNYAKAGHVQAIDARL